MTLPLPSSCEGCPFYKYRNDKGNSFTPDNMIPGSKVLFIAQNPGKNEAEGKILEKRIWKGQGRYVDVLRDTYPQPLIGATGQQFNKVYLKEAGLQRGEVSVANAIRCRPGRALGKNADDLPVITATMKLDGDKSKADIVKALKHCKSTHLHVPESVEVVVTMGRHAMFAMTGITKDEDEYKKKQSALDNWRGYGVNVHSWDQLYTVDTSYYHDISLYDHPKGKEKVHTEDGESYPTPPRQHRKVVFITMHIAALNYGGNKKYQHAVLQDFFKLGRLLRGEWPDERPHYDVIAPPIWPNYSSFDTEYNPDTKEFYRWSLCDKDYHLYCVEFDNAGGQYIPFNKGSVVLIQNALADIGNLSQLIGNVNIKIEDLMLAHSVLWSGEPHGLNYINSMYGVLNRYKHLHEGQPQDYSAFDAYEPMKVWKGYFIPQFKKDPLSWNVYKRFRLPLIPIIDKSQRRGAKIDTSLLDDVKLSLIERIEGYKQRAREITGDDDFNLGGSKQMREVMYG